MCFARPGPVWSTMATTRADTASTSLMRAISWLSAWSECAARASAFLSDGELEVAIRRFLFSFAAEQHRPVWRGVAIYTSVFILSYSFYNYLTGVRTFDQADTTVGKTLQ